MTYSSLVSCFSLHLSKKEHIALVKLTMLLREWNEDFKTL